MKRLQIISLWGIFWRYLSLLMIYFICTYLHFIYLFGINANFSYFNWAVSIFASKAVLECPTTLTPAPNQAAQRVHSAGVRLLQLSPGTCWWMFMGRAAVAPFPACLSHSASTDSASIHFLSPFYSLLMPHTNQHLCLFLFLTHGSFYLFSLAGAHDTSAVDVVVGSYWQQNEINIHCDTTVTSNWSILITTVLLCIPMTTGNDEKREITWGRLH